LHTWFIFFWWLDIMFCHVTQISYHISWESNTTYLGFPPCSSLVIAN
jgi:hypothetical protein